MAAEAQQLTLKLEGGKPWGFRLLGGKDHRAPLQITRLQREGKAASQGVCDKDYILAINDVPCDNVLHSEALGLLKTSGNTVLLKLQRGEAPVRHAEAIDGEKSKPPQWLARSSSFKRRKLRAAAAEDHGTEVSDSAEKSPGNEAPRAGEDEVDGAKSSKPAVKDNLTIENAQSQELNVAASEACKDNSENCRDDPAEEITTEALKSESAEPSCEEKLVSAGGDAGPAEVKEAEQDSLELLKSPSKFSKPAAPGRGGRRINTTTQSLDTGMARAKSPADASIVPSAGAKGASDKAWYKQLFKSINTADEEELAEAAKAQEQQQQQPLDAPKSPRKVARSPTFGGTTPKVTPPVAPKPSMRARAYTTDSIESRPTTSNTERSPLPSSQPAAGGQPRARSATVSAVLPSKPPVAKKPVRPPKPVSPQKYLRSSGRAHTVGTSHPSQLAEQPETSPTKSLGLPSPGSPASPSSPTKPMSPPKPSVSPKPGATPKVLVSRPLPIRKSQSPEKQAAGATEAPPATLTSPEAQASELQGDPVASDVPVITPVSSNTQQMAREAEAAESIELMSEEATQTANQEQEPVVDTQTQSVEESAAVKEEVTLPETTAGSEETTPAQEHIDAEAVQDKYIQEPEPQPAHTGDVQEPPNIAIQQQLEQQQEEEMKEESPVEGAAVDQTVRSENGNALRAEAAEAEADASVQDGIQDGALPAQEHEEPEGEGATAEPAAVEVTEETAEVPIDLETRTNADMQADVTEADTHGDEADSYDAEDIFTDAAIDEMLPDGSATMEAMLGGMYPDGSGDGGGGDTADAVAEVQPVDQAEQQVMAETAAVEQVEATHAQHYQQPDVADLEDAPLYDDVMPLEGRETVQHIEEEEEPTAQVDTYEGDLYDDVLPLEASQINQKGKAATSPAAKEHEVKELNPQHGLAKGLYAYKAHSQREISFQRGDEIILRRHVDTNWVEGEFQGNIGILPVNYVEVLIPIPKETSNTVAAPATTTTIQTSTASKQAAEPSRGRSHSVTKPTRKPPSAPNPSSAVTDNNAKPATPSTDASDNASLPKPCAIARHHFTADHPWELALKKGELVTLLSRVDQNWYEGRVSGKKGIFPASYVEVLRDVEGDANGNQPDSTAHNQQTQPAGDSGQSQGDVHQNGERFVALFNYAAQNSDELDLLEGDLVLVAEKCDDGWFVGRSLRTNELGTFPGNYVKAE